MLTAFSDTDAASGKEAGQTAFGAAPPADLPPFLVGQYRLGRDRLPVGHVVLAAPALCGDREDQADVGRIDVLASREPDRPQQAALAQGLAEGAARSISRVGKHATEPHA